MTSSEIDNQETQHSESGAPGKSQKYMQVPYPLWSRVVFFMPALIIGAIIGSIAGIIVGFCILAEWLKDSYLRIFKHDYWVNRPD